MSFISPAAPSTNEAIATINLSQGTDEQNAAKIDASCRSLGFYAITGHGIPQGLIDDVLKASHCFFAMSAGEKNAIHISKSHPHQRGYAPFFEETIDPSGQSEFKEAFDMGRPLSVDDPDVVAGIPFHAPNVWPQRLPSFRQALETYHAHVLTLSERLVKLTALGLNLPADYFEPHMNKAIANLRLLRYPPEQTSTKFDPSRTSVTGVGPHTDYGFLTILADDGVPGLEIQNKDGAWIAVPPVSGGFIVNTGELLQRWTNNRYQATVHKVSNRSGQDRYSIPFFLNTNFRANVAPVPTCLENGSGSLFEPVSGGVYLAERFNQTFAYRSV